MRGLIPDYQDDAEEDGDGEDGDDRDDDYAEEDGDGGDDDDDVDEDGDDDADADEDGDDGDDDDAEEDGDGDGGNDDDDDYVVDVNVDDDDDEGQPAEEACVKLTHEFFKEDTCYMLISALPDLDPGVYAPRCPRDCEFVEATTEWTANLLRQRLNGRYLAFEYLECNTSLLAMLLSGCDDSELAVSHGAILRECIRHQVAAKHKSSVAEFLSKNYDWFLQEYNTLLESPNYISRTVAMDSSKTIQLEAFHVLSFSC
ncbi:hypothetical protein L1987_13095 [Smallanthus sonchifolius]|uniref:Uncharacterized protein n=1 Tax=Smallanthus sonchifolius TaxID=185202 RepID=A0ACB9JG16_9ASTR|nr:hypothetical protein L1987_13095 [Smallanthus sonchifolius]